MEDNKLKVAPSEPNQVAQERKEPVAYAIPAGLFNQIVQYIGQGAYLQVDGLMNLIKTQSQPLYPQPKAVASEAQNTSTSAE